MTLNIELNICGGACRKRIFSKMRPKKSRNHTLPSSEAYVLELNSEYSD